MIYLKLEGNLKDRLLKKMEKTPIRKILRDEHKRELKKLMISFFCEIPYSDERHDILEKAVELLKEYNLNDKQIYRYFYIHKKEVADDIETELNKRLNEEENEKDLT
jgi:hypothetical protein